MALTFGPNSARNRKTSLIRRISALGLGTTATPPKRPDSSRDYFDVSGGSLHQQTGGFDRPQVAITIGLEWRLPPARALSWAAVCHMRALRDGWTDEPESSARNAVDLAHRALQVGENDPAILANAAFVLANSGEDIGAMMGLIDRALRLNPSFARGWYISGILGLWAGQTDLAIEHIKTSLRLSPRERIGTPLSALGQAYFFKRRFDEAAASLLLSIQDHQGFPTTYRFLAACYAHMGRLEDARRILSRLRAISPLVEPSAYRWHNAEDRELLLTGLRLAAGESD